MRDFLHTTGSTIRRELADAAADTHRTAHRALAITHGVLGGALLLDGQWFHGGCVLAAAVAYRWLSRMGCAAR